MMEIQWNPSNRVLRQFAGIWWPLFGLLVSYWLWKAGTADELVYAVVAVVAFTAVTGVWRPHWIRPLFVGWMCAAFPIGWLVSHTLLAIVYYLAVTPIGLVLRAFGRDALQRQTDPAATSYWSERHETRDESRYFRQY